MNFQDSDLFNIVSSWEQKNISPKIMPEYIFFSKKIRICLLDVFRSIMIFFQGLKDIETRLKQHQNLNFEGSKIRISCGYDIIHLYMCVGVYLHSKMCNQTNPLLDFFFCGFKTVYYSFIPFTMIIWVHSDWYVAFLFTCPISSPILWLDFQMSSKICPKSSKKSIFHVYRL